MPSTMAPLLLLLGLTAGWLIYLLVETLRLNRHRKAIPLRIAVTGTRGKTTVTRRLAAVLTQDGRRVLAKTTGSEAAYLFPDGTVQEIHRLGAPSIIEQKRLLSRGAKLGAEVVIAEVMSVHPENHRVEVQRILRPHLVLVTNFRVDHMEAQGKTRSEVASVMALDVPPGARALVPESEALKEFQLLVGEGGGEVVTVPTGASRSSDGRLPPRGCGEFGPNLDLVWEAARCLGVGDDVIRAGLCQAQDDVGALRSWTYAPVRGEPPPPEGPAGPGWILVNAFAANDPESTLRILDRVMEAEGIPPAFCVGLLSLRADRGDRSLQWAEALRNGALDRFHRLFVSGLHAHAVRYSLRRHPQADRIRILHPAQPEKVMEQILCGGREGPRDGTGSGARLLFGFGNIDGLGRTLIRHWRKVGEPHGI